MKIFKKVRSFFEDLGKENFFALLDESNRGKVKEFCKTLIIPKPQSSDSLPTELKVGDQIYEILHFLKDGEIKIDNREMVKRAKASDAHLGHDDAQYLLDNQQDIPKSLRKKVNFLFTGWRRHPNDPENIVFVFWLDNCWVGSWMVEPSCYRFNYHHKDRLLRRKS